VAGCTPREQAAAGGTNVVVKALWHCPMHPTFIRDKAGVCGICSMDLVPVEKGGGTNGIPGRSTVFIPAERMQQIGLVTTNVALRALTKTIRATATIEEDETRVATIAPRIGGFVQELYVNATGQRVQRGDQLLKLYSPELLMAEREYFNAVNAADEPLVRAARRRLELFGLDAEQIEIIQKGGGPSDTIVLKSPVSGAVMMKEVKQGASFMAGEKLYEIADLSHVWLHTFVREGDIADIRTGLTATVTAAAFPNELFDAHVTFIYPAMDKETRTLEVRLEADNAELKLKPDMWATADIEIELGEKLSVPADAVINTGKRFIAFVDKGDGHLEPRDVKVGVRTDAFIEVRGGLKDGERVVSRALFLVDSESQLQAAVSGMTQADKK
jgi:Cu(I)/Ag(I) efflux system membrane fusion protein